MREVSDKITINYIVVQSPVENLALGRELGGGSGSRCNSLRSSRGRTGIWMVGGWEIGFRTRVGAAIRLNGGSLLKR